MKTTIIKLGKSLSSIAVLIVAVGVVLTTFAAKMLPGDTQIMVNAVAIAVVAVGTYLSHLEGSA